MADFRSVGLVTLTLTLTLTFRSLNGVTGHPGHWLPSYQLLA